MRTRLIAAIAAMLMLVGASATAQAQPRVINGTDAVAGEFPFLVALADPNRVSSESAFDAQFCGGALLTAFTVVTAAHCVTDDHGQVMDSAKVEVLHGDSLSGSGAGVKVTRIQVDPAYDPNSMVHDIAVLTLASPISSGTIAPIDPTQAASLAVGTPVRAAGWGRTSPAQETYPDVAKVANLTLLPDAMCGDDGEYAINGVEFIGFSANEATASSMLCAAGVDASGAIIDTCVGDSGGPLVVGSGADARLVGIVSWGDECASHYPGVYTRVSAMQPFLLATGALAPTATPVPGGIRRAVVRKGGRVAFIVGQAQQAAIDVIRCMPVGGGAARTAAVLNGNAVVSGLRPRAYSCREHVTNALGQAQSKPMKVTARR